MKLKELLSLQAAATGPDPLLQLHDQHIAAVAKGIKDQGGIIKMTQDAVPINDDPNGEGYETCLYFGFSVTPHRRVVVRTYKNGKMESWNEQTKLGLR